MKLEDSYFSRNKQKIIFCTLEWPFYTISRTLISRHQKNSSTMGRTINFFRLQITPRVR